jgi:hypothetical protein
VKLAFLGTRRNIEARSRLHRVHSALAIAHAGRRLVIDCGADWRRRIGRLRPHAILLTLKQVSVDKEAGTLVWPNGVDFCPDVLYAEATGRAIAEPGRGLDVA